MFQCSAYVRNDWARKQLGSGEMYASVPWEAGSEKCVGDRLVDPEVSGPRHAGLDSWAAGRWIDWHKAVMDGKVEVGMGKTQVTSMNDLEETEC